MTFWGFLAAHSRESCGGLLSSPAWRVGMMGCSTRSQSFRGTGSRVTLDTHSMPRCSVPLHRAHTQGLASRSAEQAPEQTLCPHHLRAQAQGGLEPLFPGGEVTRSGMVPVDTAHPPARPPRGTRVRGRASSEPARPRQTQSRSLGSACSLPTLVTRLRWGEAHVHSRLCVTQFSAQKTPKQQRFSFARCSFLSQGCAGGPPLPCA